MPQPRGQETSLRAPCLRWTHNVCYPSLIKGAFDHYVIPAGSSCYPTTPAATTSPTPEDSTHVPAALESPGASSAPPPYSFCCKVHSPSLPLHPISPSSPAQPSPSIHPLSSVQSSTSIPLHPISPNQPSPSIPLHSISPSQPSPSISLHPASPAQTPTHPRTPYSPSRTSPNGTMTPQRSYGLLRRPPSPSQASPVLERLRQGLDTVDRTCIPVDEDPRSPPMSCVGCKEGLKRLQSLVDEMEGCGGLPVSPRETLVPILEEEAEAAAEAATEGKAR
ncbi:uncharacterized protein LOC127005067 [Eriocheir sinensis]|uniref:uncharacterized protein LOC127005067 n=1 Tax=Eriocheir sinensis TaxID=95602 RepID=UPI0021C6DC42|nr:uncharacterized protein LOC127005067 [Eriocheir sinensis]